MINGKSIMRKYCSEVFTATNKASQTIYIFILLLLIFFLFLDFFTKGYVLGGTYDRRDTIIPVNILFQKAFQNLEIPQWNSFIFCGNTLFSRVAYTFFYPLNWIVWSFPVKYFEYATTAASIGHFFLAGYFAFLLFREVIQDDFWAFCGAVSYLFSSTSTIHLLHSLEGYSTFLYLPAILYVAATSHKRGPIANFILHTILWTLLLLAGMTQYIIYCLGFIILFVVYSGTIGDGIQDKPDRRLWFIVAASIVTAFFIAAVRYVPFYFTTVENPLLTVSYETFLRDNITPPEALLRYFMPNFFEWHFFNTYSGVFFAFLGIYSILFIHAKKTLFYKLATLLIILTVLGTPLAYIHFVLTGKTNLSFNVIVDFITLCTSVLAGYAGKIIFENKRHVRRFVLFSSFLFVLVLFFAFISYYNMERDALRSGGKAALMHFITFFFILMGLFFVLRIKWQWREAAFKLMFIIFLAVDLLIFAKGDKKGQNPFMVEETLFKTSDRERAVASAFKSSGQNFRILGLSDGTLDDRGIALGLYNNSGYDNILPYYIQMLYGYPYVVPRDRARQLRPYNPKALQLTATRFVVENDGIYEIQGSLPRYSLYDDFVVLKDDRAALEALLGPAGDIDAQKKVVLSDLPELEIRQTGKRGVVRLVAENLNDIAFETDAPGNSLLLLNDSFADGWTASIDRNKTKIIRANYAFRAVAVPAGVHRIKFSYSAKGYAAGKTISILSLAGFLIIVGWFVVQRVRKRVSVAVERVR
ncbi:MAG: YfhO family protein [Nitrospirae bacterium]|nr:YfhO family protein [Nitrospirota bacterium]